jgi:hypothetical protein
MGHVVGSKVPWFRVLLRASGESVFPPAPGRGAGSGNESKEKELFWS